MKHVTIIGGGITGLATAFYLQRKAKEAAHDLRYTLLESGSHWGGKIVTRRVDDFVVEGGPDSFITQKPWGLQLCRDLGIEEQLVPCLEANQKTYVLHRNRLKELPEGFRLAYPTRLMPFLATPLLSLRGKARLLSERFIPPRRDTGDESMASFLRRRVGEETLERMAGPLMAGIFVGDPARLSMQSTFPLFIEMERKHGSLTAAFRHARKAMKNRMPSPMFMSISKGMSELVARITGKLNGELLLDHAVTGIERREGSLVVTADRKEWTTDAVVLAVPGHAAASLLAGIDREAADLLAAIRCVSTATISLGFDRHDIMAGHRPEGFGFVAPRGAGCRLLACTWTSNKLANRCAPGHFLLRAFVGGDGREEWVERGDEELVQLVRSELEKFAGIDAEPVLRRVFRWTHGNPQYDVGHRERIQRIHERLGRIGNVFVAGQLLGGVGIPDCVHSGMQVAGALVSDANAP